TSTMDPHPTNTHPRSACNDRSWLFFLISLAARESSKDTHELLQARLWLGKQTHDKVMSTRVKALQGQPHAIEDHRWSPMYCSSFVLPPPRLLPQGRLVPEPIRTQCIGQAHPLALREGFRAPPNRLYCRLPAMIPTRNLHYQPRLLAGAFNPYH